LKQDFDAYDRRNVWSPPTRGRGLKRVTKYYGDLDNLSPPTRGRGLKQERRSDI